MQRAGVVGLGDMGSGLAKNLIGAGYATTGCDPDSERQRAFAALGGALADSPAAVGAAAEAVFVMVMTGAQAQAVILGEQGLLRGMAPGGAVILSATVEPRVAAAIGAAMADSGVHLIDSPVSGGYAGAQGGSLTMMAAAPAAVLDAFAPVMAAVSSTVHRVGEQPGAGQTVKACLQSLIGSLFAATCEASVLAAAAGVPGEALQRVFAASGAGCSCTNTALGHVIDRQFAGTGSHIDTMHKDLGISLDLAAELGVPLHMASGAMQLFRAGRRKYPDGDNWAVARVIEEIVGAGLHR